MNKYTKSLSVLSSETDANKKLKVYSYLCNTQELANDHAEDLGFGYERLIQDNCAWVLSRLKTKFIQTPVWRDKYTITTWHKGMNGLFSMRDFTAYKDGKDNTPIIIGTSSWLIMDLQTRRLLRAEHVLGEDIFTKAHHEDAIEEPCGKLIFPKDMEKVTSRKVVLSDIDMNLHTNNAKYMEWAFDVLPIEVAMEREVDEFQINFNKESKAGDTIDFYIANPEENRYLIEGKRENESIFQTAITFK
jgi:acyl-ACP thioesterase